MDSMPNVSVPLALFVNFTELFETKLLTYILKKTKETCLSGAFNGRVLLVRYGLKTSTFLFYLHNFVLSTVMLAGVYVI